MGELVRDLIPELIGVGAHAARTCDRESVSQAALHDNREISLATQPPRAADQSGPPPSVLPPSRRPARPCRGRRSAATRSSPSGPAA